MKEHCTGFVPVCKRNVRVLNTGTKREVKRRLPARGLRAAARSKNERWTPCPAAFCDRRRFTAKNAKTRRRGCSVSLRLRVFAVHPKPSDEPHAQRRTRRLEGLQGRAEARTASLEIRAMEPMPSGGRGSAQRTQRSAVALRAKEGFERWTPCQAAFSTVTPAKAGVHKHRHLEYGPRLSPG